MASFVFRAINLAGVSSRGEIEAENKEAVADQLKARGLIAVDVGSKGGSREISLAFLERVKPRDLKIMTRQLATMISSGMTLLRSLHVLEAQTESKKLRETLRLVRTDVESGTLFGNALERHGKVFGPLYVSMVRAGETGGVLEDALERTADQLEKDDSLRREVRSAMIYPSVIISFAGLVLVALIAFLVPTFEKIFKDFGGELPAITKVTVTASHLVTGRWYLLLGGFVGVIVGFYKWKSSARGRPQWDALRLKAPFKIGGIVQKVALARWSRTLSALTTAGVPILQALEITGKTAGNAVVERAMDDVIQSVKSGGTINVPLKDVDVFPAMVTHMVGVGEETGALDQMLSKVADFYEDEVASAVKSLTSIIEPIMIIVVGSIVGFIVIAMYMPMFKIYDQIR